MTCSIGNKLHARNSVYKNRSFKARLIPFHAPFLVRVTHVLGPAETFKISSQWIVNVA